MKKIVALLCILTLLCLSSALAEASFTASAGGARLLTVSYDEAAFRMDTDSYLSSSRGGHTWLAMFYNGGATIELAADRYDDAPAWPIICAPSGTAAWWKPAPDPCRSSSSP